MNNQENIEKKKNKGVIVGLILLIVIIVGLIGAFLINDNPEKIFKKALSNLNEALISQINESENVIPTNLNENPFSINGNVSFKTNMDLNGYEDLKKYNYGFKVGANIKEKIMQLNINIKETNTDFLSADAYFQDEQAYLKLNGLYDKTIALGKAPLTIDIPKIDYTVDDLTYIIDTFTTTFLNTLDSTKFTYNHNVSDDYNGKTAKTKEIVYKLDEENQKRTINVISEELIKNEEFLSRLAKISGMEKDAIKKSIQEEVKNFKYSKDISVVITTQGLLKRVIEYDIFNEENVISFINYNDKQVIIIDDMTFTIEEISNNKIKLNYEMEELKGIIYITSEKQSDQAIASTVTITADGKVEEQAINFEINMNISNNYQDESIKKINVKDAVNINNISSEDAITIFTNLQSKLKNTPFEKIISNLIS